MFEGWTIQHIYSLIGIAVVCLSPIIYLVRRVDRMEIRIQYQDKVIEDIRSDVQSMKSGLDQLQQGQVVIQTDIKWIREKLESHVQH
jgi:uncharacterized protein YoxC